MTKQQIQERVLQNGKPLDLNKFTWDENTRTFSSDEGSLVLDFKDIGKVNFKTNHNCTFDTGYSCKFDTGYSCKFDTASNCTFNTGNDCIFSTTHDCTFNTGLNCVVIRRDVFEIINLNDIEGDRKHIKLNEFYVKGYTIIKPNHKITLELTDEQLEQIQKIINN